MLNPIQLNYFIKTVEHRSLNKAAKELYISQPALTKQINLLEKQIGQALFLRKQTGIEVTEAGRFLYDKAVFIIHQLEAIEEDLVRFKQQKRIRIGALPSIATYYVPGILTRFSEQDVEVSMVVKDTSQEILEGLSEDEVDIGFIQDAGQFAFDFPFIHLLTESYWAMVPKGHPLAIQEVIPFDRLIQEKMILYKDPCDIRTSFRNACHAIGEQPHLGLELDFNDSIITFVAQNHGVSIVPEMAAKELQHPSIVIKPIDSPQPFVRSVDLVLQEEKKTMLLELLGDLCESTG
jgi:DNA-binding transcriptional LysR family regulator